MSLILYFSFPIHPNTTSKINRRRHNDNDNDNHDQLLRILIKNDNQMLMSHPQLPTPNFNNAHSSSYKTNPGFPLCLVYSFTFLFTSLCFCFAFAFHLLRMVYSFPIKKISFYFAFPFSLHFAFWKETINRNC